MTFMQAFEKGIRNIFPSTFTIAISLTILTFILALFLTDPLSNSDNHFLQLLGFWYHGMWDTSLLAFAVQMMLILVLGYVLAST
ncbi:MAG: TIGR00366 family protein, partial [Bacteroidota bacterium]